MLFCAKAVGLWHVCHVVLGAPVVWIALRHNHGVYRAFLFTELSFPSNVLLDFATCSQAKLFVDLTMPFQGPAHFVLPSLEHISQSGLVA